MPKAYIQLGASGSSPSICPARATGCDGRKPSRPFQCFNHNHLLLHHHPLLLLLDDWSPLSRKRPIGLAFAS